MYDRSFLAIEILRELIEKKRLRESEICRMLDVSRGTVKDIIDDLEGVVRREGKCCYLEENIAVAVLRIGAAGASIRSFSAGEGIMEDVTLPFSEALTTEDNEVGAIVLLDKYRSALISRGYRVICCLVYEKKPGVMCSLPDIFAFVGSLEELTARGLAKEFSDSCLFVCDVSFICCEGRSVTRAVGVPHDVCGFLKECLSYAPTDRVVIEGDRSADIEALCAEIGVKCSFCGVSGGLHTYEKEVIARGLATLKKN